MEKLKKTIADIMPTIYDVACIDNDVVAVVSATQQNIKLVNLKSENHSKLSKQVILAVELLTLKVI